MLYESLLMFLCLFLSAMFSASETSYSTANKVRLKILAENNGKRAKTALKILGDFDKTITTILIGNNIVNIALATLGTVMFTKLYKSNGALISSIVVTVVVLIFGEILPKSLAKENAEKFALFIAYPLNFLIFILTPVSFLFKSLKKIFNRKNDDTEEVNSYSEDEIKYLIEEIEEQGVLEADESELVRSALEFDEKTLAKVLRPRVQVTAIDVNTTLDGVKDVFLSEMFSRIPVYENSIDNIIGYVSLKDLFKHHREEGIDLRKLTKTILKFTEFDNINNVLKIMQKKKIHIAVVLDQYGGTKGIVTLEDIVEELIGDVWDENDDTIIEFYEINEYTFEVAGDYSVEDFSKKSDIKIDTDTTTMSGWVTELFECIPSPNQTIETPTLIVTVLDTQDRQVKTIRIVKKL